MYVCRADRLVCVCVSDRPSQQLEKRYLKGSKAPFCFNCTRIPLDMALR